MKILFDSHALVWFLLGDGRCSQQVRDAAAVSEIVVSAVVVWEVSSKVSRGRWPEAAAIASAFDELLERHTYTPLPITLRHAHVAGFLATRHRDPFDRMLAAQAQVEGIRLATADPIFQELDVPILW